MDNFTSAEFSKRYRGTVGLVLFKDTKEKVPAFIHTVSSGKHDSISTAVIHAAIPPKNPLVGHTDTKEMVVSLNEIDVLPNPYRRVFDTGGVSAFYRRRPLRQWQKGICSNNSELSIINFDLFLALQKQYYIDMDSRVGTNVKHLYNLLIDNYAGSLRAALSDIDNNKIVSRCINDRYVISLLPGPKQYVLYRYNIPIAYYNRDTDTFEVINNLYLQELQDFCRRNYLSSRIQREQK